MEGGGRSFRGELTALQTFTGTGQATNRDLAGFGTLTGNLWLVNANIHRLTASSNTVLRVELKDWDGNTAYAVYNMFEVEDETNKYRLTVDAYSGTAEVSLGDLNGMFFITKDRSNDQ